MMLSPWRVISWALALIAFGIPIAAVIFFFMAILGDPGVCGTEDRTITVSPAQAATFQQRWDQLNAVLDAGQRATITVSDGEVTSRARQWVDEHDVPVDELVVCFSAGGGAASGRVDVPFFPVDVDVLVRGTIDLTGERPEVRIEDIEMGSLPGPLTDLAKNFIDELIDDQEELLGLDHDYGIAFGDGVATISGRP